MACTCRRSRCAGVTVTLPAATGDSDGLSVSGEQPANTTADRAAAMMAVDLFFMRSPERNERQGSAHGAFEVGPGVVHGAESIGILALGVEERPLCIEQIEGGGAAETVAGKGRLVGRLRLGQQFVAQINRLPPGGRRG